MLQVEAVERKRNIVSPITIPNRQFSYSSCFVLHHARSSSTAWSVDLWILTFFQSQFHFHFQFQFSIMRPFFHLSFNHPSSLCISLHSVSTSTFCPRLPTYSFHRHNSTAPVLEASDGDASELSVLNVRNVTAPHLGHIRILSLNSPENRNALSWPLLRRLRREVGAIHTDIKAYPGIGASGPMIDAEEIRHTSNISRMVKSRLNVSGSTVNGKAEANNDDVKNHERNGELVLEGPPRVLILASEVDGVFCAGADLKERKNMTKDE